jgi:hypothetical protein
MHILPLSVSTAPQGISRATTRVAPLDAPLGTPFHARGSWFVNFTRYRVHRFAAALNMVAREWSGKAGPPSVGEFSLPTL